MSKYWSNGDDFEHDLESISDFGRPRGVPRKKPATPKKPGMPSLFDEEEIERPRYRGRAAGVTNGWNYANQRKQLHHTRAIRGEYKLGFSNDLIERALYSDEPAQSSPSNSSCSSPDTSSASRCSPSMPDILLKVSPGSTPRPESAMDDVPETADQSLQTTKPPPLFEILQKKGTARHRTRVKSETGLLCSINHE